MRLGRPVVMTIANIRERSSEPITEWSGAAGPLDADRGAIVNYQVTTLP